MSRPPNYCAIVQGFAESGKTTLLRQHAITWLNRGAAAFFHDPDRQFSCDAIPHFPRANDWRRTYARWLSGDIERMPRAASIGDVDDDPITDLVRQVAESWPGPVYVGYDEACLMSNAQSNYVTPKLVDLVSRRRHRGVCVEFLAQDFGMLHKVLQTQATNAFLFRCTDEERIRVIAKRFAVDRGALHAAVVNLPERYHYIEVRPGRICTRAEASDV